MNATLVIILVLAVIVVVALVAVAVVGSRRRALRQRFGPEYDLVVAEQDGRSAGERELRERERRHAELDLRPLSPDSRTTYAEQWGRVQTRFVDSPEEAVREGDELVTKLIGEIGYPTEDYESQIATLSVEHATTLGHYRDAHAIFLRAEGGDASTEQLRQALVHYRVLFAELLGDDPVPAPEPHHPVEPSADTEPSADVEPSADAERRADAAPSAADNAAPNQPDYR
jgi:hypothetical protein